MTKLTKEQNEQVVRFYLVLKELINGLCKRYPSNITLKLASMNVNSQGKLHKVTAAKRKMVRYWIALVQGHEEAIEKHHTEEMISVFDNSTIPFVSAIGIGKMLADPTVDEETKEGFWAYLLALTKTAKLTGLAPIPESEEATDTEEDDEEEEEDAEEEQQQEQGTTVPTAPASTRVPAQSGEKPDFNQAIGNLLSTFQENAPAMLDSLNKAFGGSNENGQKNPLLEMVGGFLKPGEGGSSPLMDAVNQLLNPDSLNTGLASNLAALAAGSDDGHGSVMQSVQQQTGLSAAEISRRLEQLDLKNDRSGARAHRRHKKHAKKHAKKD